MPSTDDLYRLLLRTQADLAQLRAQTTLRPVATAQQPSTVRILGGNLQNGVGTIKYVAGTIAVPQLYNPLVNVVYVDGLGYGDLFYPNSLIPTRVVVRHDFFGHPDSLLASDSWRVWGYDQLAVTRTALAAPPGAPEVGDTYAVGPGGAGDFAGHDGQYATWNGSAWTFSATDPNAGAELSVAKIRR